MADNLELEVATPERELVRELVSEVQVPGKNGYMGILPGHAPLLGLLGIGTLAYVSVSDGKKRYLSTHGGFVEVLDDHVRVLADCAERAEEIDIQRAKAALQQNGIEIIDEENRTTGIFTGRQMYFHDPDRNVLELTEWQGKEF